MWSIDWCFWLFLRYKCVIFVVICCGVTRKAQNWMGKVMRNFSTIFKIYCFILLIEGMNFTFAVCIYILREESLNLYSFAWYIENESYFSFYQLTFVYCHQLFGLFRSRFYHFEPSLQTPLACEFTIFLLAIGSRNQTI